MKRVKLSHDLPKQIQKELHSEDNRLSSIKEYLSDITHIQPHQLDTLIDTKIKNKPLQLVNMIDNSSIYSQRELKIPFLPKPKHVKSWTIKQLPENLQRFQIYQPLNQLWSKYMDDLLSPHVDQKEDIILSKFTKADYHGAIMTINDSKCSSLVGITGIVLHESAHMFSLVCTDNKARSIPKKETIFTIPWKRMIFRIYGNHLIMAPSERATKKLKSKNTIELGHQ